MQGVFIYKDDLIKKILHPPAGKLRMTKAYYAFVTSHTNESLNTPLLHPL